MEENSKELEEATSGIEPEKLVVEENSKEVQSVVLSFNKNSIFIVLGFVLPLIALVYFTISNEIQGWIVAFFFLTYFIIYTRVVLAKSSIKDVISVTPEGLSFEKLGFVDYAEITSFKENKGEEVFVISTKKHGKITIGKQTKDKTIFIDFYRNIAKVLEQKR